MSPYLLRPGSSWPSFCFYSGSGKPAFKRVGSNDLVSRRCLDHLAYDRSGTLLHHRHGSGCVVGPGSRAEAGRRADRQPSRDVARSAAKPATLARRLRCGRWHRGRLQRAVCRSIVCVGGPSRQPIHAFGGARLRRDADGRRHRLAALAQRADLPSAGNASFARTCRLGDRLRPDRRRRFRLVRQADRIRRRASQRA